jgi:hypothetical protein
VHELGDVVVQGVAAQHHEGGAELGHPAKTLRTGRLLVEDDVQPDEPAQNVC